MRHRLATALVALAAVLTIAAPAAATARTVAVVVVLADAGTPGAQARAHAADVARAHGLAPTRTYGWALSGFAAQVPAGRLEALRHDPRVAYVDHDGTVEALAESAPWGVARIGLDTTDRSGANVGAGVDVYVLDTGIDADHPDLAANLGSGHAVEGCRGRNCLTAWDDDHGHGTHVAGTVGAIDNDRDVIGVAPGVTLHAVKVLDRNGSGTRSGVIAGIDWVAEQVAASDRPAVANMSLGGSGSKSGACTSSGFVGTDAYHQAICNASRVGTVFAVAAGNSDADASAAVPAAYDDTVITVSATSSSNDWPYWSNWGNDTAAWTSVASAPVAIAAPGVSVVSTRMGGGTTTMSGTSMAAPHVAGALALFLVANPQSPGLSAFTNARSALLAEADPTSPWTNTSGNPHAEPFLDVRSWVGATVEEPAPDPGTGTITLTATGFKVKGEKWADLTWSGATSTAVDVHVDGQKRTTTGNDGAEQVLVGGKGGGTHTVRVCEAGTSTCSAVASVTY